MYKDCGDLQTHGRIVELFPLSLKDGASTRLNIKAILDTSVKSAVGQYHVKTVTSTLPWVTALGNFGDCFGDAGEPIHSSWLRLIAVIEASYKSPI